MADLGNSLAETQPGLTFVGTGLLDLEPDMEDASSASRPLEFIPNGLLGPPDSPSPIAQSQDIEMLSTISDDAFRDPMVDSASLASQLMFVSNGLLDITEPDGPGLPDDDDELLLPLSQLFPKKNPTSVPNRRGYPAFASVKATTFQGRNVFFSRKNLGEAELPRIKHRVIHDFPKLLETPIHRLMGEVAMLGSKVDQDCIAPAARPGGECDMWVDRYKPSKFMDLVGEERVHRDVMAWVKEWDVCVFNRRRPKGLKRPTYKIFESKQESERKVDEYGRPYEKLLLLAGPPGVGKTTVAHVIASQAGYSVLEINASDSRSGDVIEDRIRPAIEAGKTVGSTKPVLVVIDEIDGATGENTGSFVQKLIALTLDKSRKKIQPGKKGKTGPMPLLRPIICICNDLWAPSLSRLRQHCRVIRFNAPGPTQLTERLRDICATEDIQVEGRALTSLVAICQGDMRGCLNTLQIIRTKSQTINESIIRAATVGMKESETSAQSVWNGLFFPLTSKKTRDLGLGKDQEPRYVGRLSRLLEAGGSYDKIAGGCFEHYMRLHQYDPSWRRFESGVAWLTGFDSMSSGMRDHQNYQLLAYLPYSLIPLHPLFASAGNVKVERPKADWECYVSTKAHEEIYKTFAASLLVEHGARAAPYRHLLTAQTLRLEFAPLLNRIIAPPIRPVNSQVIRVEEKALLKKLVGIMVSLDLHFVQERAEDGSIVFRLDPPIDAFVTYEGKRASDIPMSKFSVRQMVATALDAELIARGAAAADEPKRSLGNLAATLFPTKRTVNTKQPGPGVAHIDYADRPPVDFFGRPIIITKPDTTTTSLAPAVKKYRVTFKFSEGSSAAVRKPIKMGSLL